MASNPMQRKSRNSFLLGMIITLLITGVIIVLLFLQLKQKNDELNAEINAKVKVYTLTQSVKSGQVLTQDMFKLQKIHKDSIPSNATSVASVIESWFLQTKEGEMISTDKYGLYLDRTSGERTADCILEVMQYEGADTKDANGKELKNGDLFTFVNGEIEKVSSDTKTIQDEFGVFIVAKQDEDDKTRIYQEDETGEFYTFRLDNSTMNTGDNRTRMKEYIGIKDVPVLAKISMNKNTVITPNLVVQSDEVITDDVRKQEYNMVILPVDLMTDDYIDIRLMTPSGQDFIVISKAKVDVPMNEDGTYITDTIRLNLREDEILAMSSAIVEAYGLLGSKLYATKYVEPGMQEPISPTYTPNSAVTAQIQSNPNIVEQAKQELATRYSEAAKRMRNDYLQSLINVSEDYNANIQDRVEQDITKSNATRQEYLETLETLED